MTQLTGKGSLIAGALAAIGASVCCVGPLVLLAFGIGGTWIGSLTAMEPYRPIFIGLTLLFAFWIIAVLLLGLLAVPWIIPFFY
jgi:mercuric ion transport protein